MPERPLTSGHTALLLRLQLIDPQAEQDQVVFLTCTKAHLTVRGIGRVGATYV